MAKQTLITEIQENAKKFYGGLAGAASQSQIALWSESSKYIASYVQIVPLQSWRQFVIETHYSEGSKRFFLEAQNDALASMALAYAGAWRPALQTLRSSIEGVLASIFYNEHPIELELWERGKHRLSFVDYYSYFGDHPRLCDLERQLHVVQDLKAELSTLSKGVHASAHSFRMTGAGFPALLIGDAKRVGMWHTRVSKSMSALNLLLLAINQQHLRDTSTISLRTVAAVHFSNTKRAKIKKLLNIKLPLS